MERAGVSITITSLTSFLAFVLSGTSSLPALSSFALSTAFGILFDFLNQITIFSVFVYYDLLRIERNWKDCFWLNQCAPRSLFFCRGKLALDENDKIKKSGV